MLFAAFSSDANRITKNNGGTVPHPTLVLYIYSIKIKVLSMKINLLPCKINYVMQVRKRIILVFDIILCLILIAACIFNVYADIVSAISISLIFIGIMFIVSYPSFRHEKVGQSSAELTEDRILIASQKGKVWREILLDSITTVEVDTISGFFWGQYKEDVKLKYICLYLNGTTERPFIFSYKEWFRQKDFMIIGYEETFYQQLLVALENRSHCLTVLPSIEAEEVTFYCDG